MNVLWKVSLSNGETLYEEKGDYQIIPGQLSPWQRLLRHMVDVQAYITSLALYTRKGQTFNLPSLSKNPKFHVFANAKKPTHYTFYRKYGHDVYENEESADLFSVIEAQYETYKLQLWVDEKHPENCWTLVEETYVGKTA